MKLILFVLCSALLSAQTPQKDLIRAFEDAESRYLGGKSDKEEMIEVWRKARQTDGINSPLANAMAAHLSVLHIELEEYDKAREFHRFLFSNLEAGLTKENLARIQTLKEIPNLYASKQKWNSALETSLAVLTFFDLLKKEILQKKGGLALELRPVQAELERLNGDMSVIRYHLKQYESALKHARLAPRQGAALYIQGVLQIRGKDKDNNRVKGMENLEKSAFLNYKPAQKVLIEELLRQKNNALALAWMRIHGQEDILSPKFSDSDLEELRPKTASLLEQIKLRIASEKTAQQKAMNQHAVDFSKTWPLLNLLVSEESDQLSVRRAKLVFPDVSNIRPEKVGRLTYWTLRKSSADAEHPKNNHRVRVHYTGWLKNQRVFDSSVERGVPFEFKVGHGVIEGWNRIIRRMKTGQKVLVEIPPDEAYGSEGTEGIPPNATLLFEIELLEIIR